jgi:hypothetical protein
MTKVLHPMKMEFKSWGYCIITIQNAELSPQQFLAIFSTLVTSNHIYQIKVPKNYMFLDWNIP